MTIRLITLSVFWALALLCAPPFAAPALAACVAPNGSAGTVVYNATQKVFQYCSDTQWVAVNTPGSGTGGCTDPVLNEGNMVYNADQQVMQGCAGNVHRAFSAPQMGSWAVFSVGAAHACGIKHDGTLWCWGVNTNGRLGDGTTTERPLQTAVSGGGQWIDVSAGDAHSCGIKNDGSLWCWGLNGNGQLGDNSTTQRLVPTAINGGGTWKTLVAGYRHTCGIKSDDTLWCWGANGTSQLGDSTTTQRNIPTAVQGGWTWKAVALGYKDATAGHTCAIRADAIGLDKIYCWGVNDRGQLGTGTTLNVSIPAEISGGSTWKYLAAGSTNTCGIKTNDTLHCWGDDTYSQIGDSASSSYRSSPTAVDGGGTWKSVSIGNQSVNQHACGIRSDDTVWCWGSNPYQALTRAVSSGYSEVPVAITGGGSWRQLSLGANTSCGIKTNNAVLCWGERALGASNEIFTPFPKAVNGGGAWEEVSSELFPCGIKAGHTAWCWGSRYWPVPFAATGAAQDMMKITSGYNHVCGINRADNITYCWGNNNGNLNGQLGDGTTTARTDPTAVGGGADTWIAISAGGYHTCGIKANSTLWCWGYNYYGQLGDNSTTQRNNPTAINGGGTWKAVSAGDTSTCAIKSDDTLWCWGENTSGQLGDNTLTQRLIPTPVNGGGAWQAISGGSTHTCGIKTDKTLWCWGMNTSGQLGDGTGTNRRVPTAVNGGGTWLAVDPGFPYTCGIKADKTLWCWGGNSDGQLGDGTTTNRSTPTAIIGGGVWDVVSAGSAANTCAISAGIKALYCWGSNEMYRLTELDEIYPWASYPRQIYCNAPAGKAGEMVYNTTANRLQYCNGSAWVVFGAKGG